MKIKFIVIITFFVVEFIFGQNWKVPENTMMTRWAKELTPENVLPEYPRPNLQRDEWLNLNGLWEYAITTKE